MNIAERKIKLVEKILHLVNDENVARFEEMLENESLKDSTVVTHSINGREISLKEYREKNERAEASYAEGKYKTSEQLKEKFKSK
ncbi:hypothetical protein [Aequorivita lipolytica]|uniref:Uncharacterized protein n=1 Tax=Aequorivita lipolytica TaxID=153267 RepID=A0A5C6YRP8_9FLAO|nr:hypothetical protein [Aequorivita lipolytica]TXD70189.1 hypothetical protein ESV24_03200 [Aequorivita lipolytica]SRX50608.1 hypothetical protein AEQU2_01082 [Aequorivita lipolytica]